MDLIRVHHTEDEYRQYVFIDCMCVTLMSKHVKILNMIRYTKRPRHILLIEAVALRGYTRYVGVTRVLKRRRCTEQTPLRGVT